jgi:hypothetical protein
MATTTKTAYGEELVDKGLALVQTAQHLALDYIGKGIETVRAVAPQAHEVLGKVDVVDTKHAVDSAFEAATRVIASQRRFVGDMLGTVFGESTPEPAPAKKTTSTPAA